MENPRATVLRPEIAPGRRVIAVSDIHGNLPLLQGLLEKVCFSPADALVLVGDLLEKGQHSLDTLRYVMALGETHTVYPLCGNCDHIDRTFLQGGPGADEALWPVFRFWQGRGLIAQMAAGLGLSLDDPKGLPAVRRAILEGYPREVAFLFAMPHILQAGNFIFVHGGIPREEGLEELEAYPCMKNDDFLGQNRAFRHWVVVGHWPVTLYHPDKPDASPIIDRARHIVSIDGGCVLKVDGQLNALLIPDVYGEAMTTAAYDGFPVVVAQQAQAPSRDPLNIRWSDSAVEVLREEGDCCWCRHLSTGRELWILREYIYPRREDGSLHCEDSTDYLLPVQPGDRLALVRRCSRGLLVKKHGVTGWYLGPVRPAEKENRP